MGSLQWAVGYPCPLDTVSGSASAAWGSLWLSPAQTLQRNQQNTLWWGWVGGWSAPPTHHNPPNNHLVDF